MTRYESIFILDNNAEKDSIVDTLVEKFKSYGAEVEKVDRWGKKRLAYEIGKRQYGDYTCLEFNADPASIAKMERDYRLNENVIRFFTHVVSKRQLKQRANDKKAAESAPNTTSDRK